MLRPHCSCRCFTSFSVAFGFCHSRTHSAALPLLTSQNTPDWPFCARSRWKGFRLELQSRWICVKSDLPCFLNPELVFLEHAVQSRAQMILYWKFCNAVYSVWTVLMFFRLLRFEKHLCHRPLDAGATCYQLRELMLLWLTAIWYNNERTSSPQKICWCVHFKSDGIDTSWKICLLFSSLKI